MQAIYDVVGDKIQEIFDAQVVDIGMFDFAAGVTPLPVHDREGRSYPDEPTPIELSLEPTDHRDQGTGSLNDDPASEAAAARPSP